MLWAFDVVWLVGHFELFRQPAAEFLPNDGHWGGIFGEGKS